MVYDGTSYLNGKEKDLGRDFRDGTMMQKNGPK
jgi:hypothetical protein